MGQQALLDALNAEARSREEAIREETRKEAERVRREAQREEDALRREHVRTLESRGATLREDLLAEARQQVGRIREEAMAELAARLYEQATQLLPELAQAGGGLFERLAAELPSLTWAKVRVAAKDKDRAHQLFPQAAIEVDEAICAGMEVWAQGGQFQVINTLAIRLSRAWPDMLPALMAEIVREVDADVPTSVA